MCPVKEKGVTAAIQRPWVGRFRDRAEIPGHFVRTGCRAYDKSYRKVTHFIKIKKVIDAILRD